MKKHNKDCINEITETFQVSSRPDIKSLFFDLSANFYNLREDEKPPSDKTPPDQVILDIGGAFGDFDASKIPWDAENKGYLPSDALWGVVSQQATAALFNKMNDIKQTADIGKLPFDEEKKKFTYESPLFMSSATTQEEKIGLEAAEQIVNLAYPIVFELMARGELISTLKSLGKGTASLGKLLGKVLTLNGRLTKAAAQGLRIAGILSKTVDKAALKAADKIVGEAAEKVASEIGQKAGAKATTKATANVAAKVGGEVGEEVAEKMSAKIGAKIAKILGSAAMKMVGKVIQGFAISFVSLGAIPYIGPTLDIIYMVVVMPLMMGLTMGGIIDGALEKVADTEGCCPPNSVPFNELIPEAGMMIISNIPIIGDILSLFYPYVCSRNDGALVYKSVLTLPKWMEYPWLTCYYLQWPEYSCRIGGRSRVNGKKYVGGSTGYDWNNGLGAAAPYTMLSPIVNNQGEYCQTIRRFIGGQIDDTEKQCVLPSPNMNFFYADFSESLMLKDMGIFYYNWALKNPTINNDGTISVEYITKINYVTASSLYTCDVMCEMVEVTFNPITGEDYSETVTYDRDRRFYYSCDNSVKGPRHWEDDSSRLTAWRALDNAYDLAVYDLNSHLGASGKTNPAVLLTKYNLMMDASNRYVYTSNITLNNLSNEIFERFNTSPPLTNLHTMVRADPTVRVFFNAYKDAEETLPKSGVTLNKIATVYNRAQDMFRFRYSPESPSHHTNQSLKNNQYTLLGCTHLDYTASAAATPNANRHEEDSRYRCNFDVTPFLVRCTGANMSISKCIDASNIELVIYSYLLQNPTKRIKTINSIKAKGRNACEFMWNEVIINPTTKVQTSSNNNVNTTIIYQQDLSSCTFSLPPPVNCNYLFGSQTGASAPIGLPDSSIKMFKNPVNPTDVNYSNYTTLAYKEAKFKFPQFTPPKPMPTSFIESNVDYVPRFNPATFKPIPDLIRPRKPIRVSYPGEEESTLGNYASNYCADSAMLQRVLLSYNGNSNNANKIINIARTFTSSSNTCDMEVDLMYPTTNHVKRVTMTMNMVEGFQTASTSNSRRFNYQSVNPTSYGLNIDRTTDSLSNPFEEGVNYGDPYLRSFQRDVAPYTTFFNDDLIKGFTSKTKSIRDHTSRLLVGLTGSRRLGRPPCNTRCQEPEIVQRIIEQYNKDGAVSTRLDAEKNSVIQVLNSATNSSNTCHVLLQNKLEMYGDFYSNNRNSDSNYYTENKLKFKKVKMEDAGNCTFYPEPNQEYQDIPASDLALSSSANFNTYITPKRTGCPPVNCLQPQLYEAAFEDYEEKTDNKIHKVKKAIGIGDNKCDYLINTSIMLSSGIRAHRRFPAEEGEDPEDAEDLDFVLRVSYDAPLYRYTSAPNCATDFNYRYRYNEANFVLQTPLELNVDNQEYYQVVDSNSTFTSPLSGEIDDNITIRNAVKNLVINYPEDEDE